MSLKSVKKGPNFEVYEDGTGQKLIRIDNVRVSYPAFGAQKEQEDSNGDKTKSWGGVAMLSKATHVQAKDAFTAILNEIAEKEKVKIPPEFRCIKNGDDKDQEEYQKHWLINFSDKKRRPAVRDEHSRLMIDPERAHDHEYIAGAISAIDETFFGGVWISVLLRPWYFNGKAKGSAKTYPKRLCCGFTGVRFVKTDKPFGSGRIDDSDAWGEPTASNDGMSGDDGDDGL
jgi:hypothetical protein